MTHVDPVMQAGQVVTFVCGELIGSINHGRDVGEALPCLCGNVADVDAAVTDDARSAGNEQDFLSIKAGYARAGEGRAARAVPARVIIGADLAWVLDRNRFDAPAIKQTAKCARTHSYGTSGGHTLGRGPPIGGKTFVAAAVELPIALGSVGVAVDFRI